MSKRNHYPRVGRFETLEARIVFDATYFVDPVNGSDDHDGLSQTSAVRTVANLVSQYDAMKPAGHIELAPGDTVVLMPGEHHFAYRYGEGQWQGLFWRNVHGTADKPITVRGMEGAKIDNRAPDGSEMSSINILQSSHIVIENLDVTSYGSAIIVAESSDVVVRDNYIHDVDGIAANNLSGVHLIGVQNTVIENNLFTDNYDRAHPGNANNRHIVIFGGVDVKVLGNTMRNSDPNAGLAVDYKHLGSLTADQVGQYEVAYNTIINAAGTAIGTAAPNSYIHHNLLVDSGSIRVADFGGTNQLANERIEYNTIVNNLDRFDGGGLSYYPNEYQGYPLGDTYWSHNLVVDNRSYNHSEKGTIVVDRYGSDEFYHRAIAGGLFHAEGNVYQTHDTASFDIYGANGGRYGELGSNLTFAQWQAAGYDRSGSVSSIAIDDNYRDLSTGENSAGIYAGSSSRLTAFVSQIDVDEAGDNSTTRLRIVRSGDSNAAPLQVSLAVSQSNEIELPQQVIIPAGVDAIEVEIRGLADTRADATEALQIHVTSDGLTEASTWVRLHDSPPSDPSDDSHDLNSGIFQVPGIAGEKVRLQSTVTQRFAEYDNEMGIAYVDDSSGRVGNLLPTDSGWVQALMNRGQSLVALRSGVGQGDAGQIELTAGRFYVFYLVQDSSTDTWRAINPTNAMGANPLLFTSVADGNSDNFDHVHELINESFIDLAWEDLEFGGDQSFRDLVVQNEYLPMERFCQAVDDLFSKMEADSIELDVLANDQVSENARIASTTQPEFGTVSVSEAGDRLLYEAEPHRYGLVHFSYRVDAMGKTTSANVELAISKNWTNDVDPSDVNHDGRVSPIDALVVINALNNYGELALTDYPEGELASLGMIDVNGDKQLSVTDALTVVVDILARLQLRN